MILVSTYQCIKDDTDRAIMEKSVPVLKRSYMKSGNFQVCIDNIEIAAFTNHQLTTMNVQKTAMGSRGVEMIVNGTAQQNENALDILLPTNLVERASC